MNSIRQQVAVIALCGVVMGCSADTERSSVKYQEKDVDYSSASIGAFPQVKLSENMGAFVLPQNALKHLRPEDIVPPKGSRIWQLCEQLNHHPNLLVSAAPDETVHRMETTAQKNRGALLCFIWLTYAFEREAALSKLSATGVLSAKEVNEILQLNVWDVYLRAFDSEYGIRMPQIVNQVNASVKSNQNVDLETRVNQLQKQFQEMMAQTYAGFKMKNIQQDQAMMDWAIGGLNQIRARNKQRRDNFWACRERKLEGSQTAPQYQGTSNICRYCGRLATVAGKCPVSSDGRHHCSPYPGPKWDEKWN